MLAGLFIGAFSLIFFPLIAFSLNCISNVGVSDFEPFPPKAYFARFNTRLEMRLSNRNATYYAEEWFDAEKYTGVVSIWAEDKSYWGAYFDKSKKEIDHVFEKNCDSFEWTQQGFDRFRCRFPPNESSLKLIGDACSATVVLDLVFKNETKNARYLGKKTVRDIPIKGWRICKNDTAMDYWLTVSDWPVPVLVEARPESAPNLNAGLKHSYSFLNFITGDFKYELPDKFWCQGAFNPPPLPKLPRRFDVNLESVNTETSRIRGVREYYDLDRQLFRVDFDARGTQPPMVGTGPTIDIRNMKTGKSTRYNRGTGRCGDYKVGEARIIVTRYNYRIDTPYGKVVLFEDPQAIPAYQGRRVTRQIDCDVWQQTRVNWPGNIQGRQVWRWYFTQRSWVQNKEPSAVPVKLEIEGTVKLNATSEAKLNFNLNFYAFESQSPTPHAFDLSSLCMQSSTTQQKIASFGAMKVTAVAGILLGLII